jgi:hypothetical protein
MRNSRRNYLRLRDIVIGLFSPQLTCAHLRFLFMAGWDCNYRLAGSSATDDPKESAVY